MLGNSMQANGSVAGQPDFTGLADQIAAIRQDSAVYRRHKRFEVDCPMVVLVGTPQNGKQIRGMCRDISKSGMGAILDQAPPVGEEMWLMVDGLEHVDGPVHAQCVRCRVIPNEQFEVGFLFFTQLNLPDSENQTQQPKQTDSLI